MFKTLIVALLVAVAVNGASSSYLIGRLDDGIEEARRQSSRTEAGSNATNQEILYRIGAISEKMTRYANGFQDHMSEYLSARETAVSDFGHINNSLDAISLSDAEMSKSLDDQERRLNSTNVNVMSLQDLMAEVNTKLTDLETGLESSKNMNVVHEVLNIPEERDIHEELSIVQPCAALPINKDEQASSLHAAVGNSRTAGVHDVTVLFDIETDGSTILRSMESPTASSRQRNAVSRYINGLRFNRRESLLHDCEMVVKLDIRSD